ncbi:MAG: MFS transporter [Deltaproteobacteria bacterium]|nr:MFS transporter [Deltaproteobacteria bacterium]
MNSAHATASAPAHAPQATQTSPLSLGVKVSYGVGDIVVAIRMSSVVNFLLFFYTNVVMLSPSLAGLALAIGRIWDGVNDPLVGYLSDSTTSRFGRRRPYLLASILPLGLTFFLLWSPPQGLGSLGNFLFLAAAYILMDTFFTLYATPYMALGAELSRDYHERTQVVTVRALFHILGAVLAVVCLSKVVGGSPATLQEGAATLPTTLPSDVLRMGFAKVGAILGGVMALSGLIAFSGSREAPPPGNGERVSFGAFFLGLKNTLKNQPFRSVILTFAVMTLGWGVHQPLTVYVYRDWLTMEKQLPTILSLYLFSTMLSLGVWTRLARHFGKNRAFQLCILYSVAVLSVFPLLRADMPREMFYLFIVFAGLGAGGYIIPVSIVADVIDYDELLTGQRREGAFFGLWTLTIKLVAALAIALVGVALDLIGYVPNQPQSVFTLWGLKMLYGPVPAFFLFLSFLAFLRFPLTRESHAEIQRQLQARR